MYRMIVTGRNGRTITEHESPVDALLALATDCKTDDVFAFYRAACYSTKDGKITVPQWELSIC